MLSVGRAVHRGETDHLNSVQADGSAEMANSDGKAAVPVLANPQQLLCPYDYAVGA